MPHDHTPHMHDVHAFVQAAVGALCTAAWACVSLGGTGMPGTAVMPAAVPLAARGALGALLCIVLRKMLRQLVRRINTAAACRERGLTLPLHRCCFALLRVLRQLPDPFSHCRCIWSIKIGRVHLACCWDIEVEEARSILSSFHVSMSSRRVPRCCK